MNLRFGHHLTKILFLLLSYFVGGCGDGATDPSDSSGGGQIAIIDGQVSLGASDAREVASGAQETNYEVTVSITNGLDDAISIAPGLFRMRAGGLEYLAAGSPVGPCPSDVLLAAGASVSCGLQFNIPSASAPNAVVMTTPIGNIEAPTRPVACTKCGGLCTDLMTSQKNCGVCNRAAPTFGSCVDGVPTCPQEQFTCNNMCTRLAVECALDSGDDRTPSCQARCAAIAAQCTFVEAYYRCSDNTTQPHPEVGCDDEAPPQLNGCGPFMKTDCRCRH